MGDNNKQGWNFNKQLNLSVIIQLILLASLIIGSWVNLQSQMNVLSYDMERILECQKQFQSKIENISMKNITYECRLKTLEEKAQF